VYTDLFPYYERELAIARELFAAFAEEHSEVAGNLLLKGGASDDPHVERLIQGMALIAARVHKRLDDDLPELTDAFLNIVFPHLLRPVPSLSIVEFCVNPQAEFTAAQVIPRGTEVSSRAVRGAKCRFQTVYPVSVVPLEVVDSRLETVEKSDLASVISRGADLVLRIKLRAIGGAGLAKIKIDSLRFFIDGDSAFTHRLYECLFNGMCGAAITGVIGSQRTNWLLPVECLGTVGLAPNESLTPEDARNLAGQRLLQEYCVFPDKFLFFDIAGLAPVSNYEREVEICLFVRAPARKDLVPTLMQAVTERTFRLHCTPIVNLFSQMAEPIRVEHDRYEYMVVPDIRRSWSIEVYSIDAVRKFTRDERREALTEYRPLFALTRGAHEKGKTYWHSVRRPARRPDAVGSDVFLSLVDQEMNPTLPASESLSVWITCTNGDLPAQLPFGGEAGEFGSDGLAFVERIVCLKKPTAAVRPVSGKGAIWRLISQLALNHLSLSDESGASLREILRVHNLGDSASINRAIDGIVSVRLAPGVARMGGPPRQSFVRGWDVELKIDENQFAGLGAYLFGSVLERFLSLYGMTNSYTSLTMRTAQREGEMARWPPRSGGVELI
jgi:type VI secretion system protein ImpG